MNILIAILVGLIAGALAGYFVRGRGFGVLGDTLIGLIGGLVGGLIFNAVGLDPDNIIGSIIVAFVGASILLLIAKMFKSPDAGYPEM